MIRCPSCGEANPEPSRICGSCLTPLGVRPSRQVRKTVTVLFSDIAGSTALGERLDPETVRILTGTYFQEIKAVIERHGGTVEKFIGDAVMAVFGIPRLHEDDALRAVRAAVAIREVLAEMNTSVQARRGIRIEFRTGINTGEVVTAAVGREPTVTSGQTLVTGDPVNTAARLEQAAAPGEILIGASTYELVRDAVSVEPVEPIEARGKADRVRAYRLLGITGTEGHLRRRGAPLLGREAEWSDLQTSYRATVERREPHLVTVIGAAGVGKSRLVAEFLASVETEATVLKGRCLPYGEGITYWPLREVVQAAAGIDDSHTGDEARARLKALVGGDRDAELIAARVGAAIGLSSQAAPQDEIFWASRKLLGSLAAAAPTIVVFEDIHWAEPTFLDLVAYLSDVTLGAPLLLICPARTELEGKRTRWGSGQPDSRTIRLEGLSDETTRELVATLPGGTALPAALKARIVERAEGNPLFVEEMLAMLLDEHLVEARDGGWVATPGLADIPIPASIGILLAARIDALPDRERTLAERSSVMGRSFEAAAARELIREGTSAAVTRSLRSLVRKALLQPEQAELTAGDAFKFRHILIRDAAYRSLAKGERADLHERFADWMERVAGERIAQLEEVLGYHLEQAARYLMELGVTGERRDRVADRAARWLIRAGRAARGRQDLPAAESVLRRAVDLGPANATLADACGELGGVLARRDRPQESIDFLDRAIDLGEGVEPPLAARAKVDRWTVREMLERPVSQAVFDAEFQDVVATLEPAGDHLGLARAWRAVGNVHDRNGDEEASRLSMDRALHHAEASGDQEELQGSLLDLLISAANDRTPLREAVRVAEQLLAMPTIWRTVHASVLAALSRLEALRGDVDIATDLGARALEEAIEVGDGRTLIDVLLAVGLGELELGRMERAVELFQRAYESTGFDQSARPYVAARLAQAHAYAGHHDLALRFVAEVEETLTWDELLARGAAEAARGIVELGRGDLAGAERWLRQAVATAASASSAQQHARLLLDLAGVLERTGQSAEAVESAAEALGMYELKGNVVGAARAQAFLERVARP